MSNTEPTIKDLFDVFNEFSTNIDKRFNGIDERLDKIDERLDKMDERFDRMDERLDKMDERFDRMDERFDSLEERLTRVESLMVTKDYLDYKIAELKDVKLNRLLEILKDKNVLDEKEENELLAILPFAKV